MRQTSETKRLFFAFEALAPWPPELPSGRYLAEKNRHLTVAFLGEVHFPSLIEILPQIPKPNFTIGKAGIFNCCLFLPERHPNVVAWHVDWLDDPTSLVSYHKKLAFWLNEHGFLIKKHENGFLPHITICRKPFQLNEWRKAFSPLPMMIKDFNLYESLGHSCYRSRWSYSIKSPFEELEHTADVAFLIRGNNISEIYKHARMALAFLFPLVLSILVDNKELNSLDDVIICLNEIITVLDQKEGSPFKAVSFHGTLKEVEDKTLEWEMIVDV
jgi:2'-5' RNA ligase